MRNVFFNDLSGRGTGNVVGRGAAMTASHIESRRNRKKAINCFNCGESGYFNEACPSARNDSKKGVDATEDQAGGSAGRSTKK